MRQTTDSYEMRVIEYESELNEAKDKWFNARPSLDRNVESEFIFDGGFRMAWEGRKCRPAADA